MENPSVHRQLLVVLTAMSAIVLAFPCCYSPPLHAQGSDFLAHPELYVEVQDDVYIKRVDSKGQLMPEAKIISAAYRFEMIYDSTCRVQYLFSECRHNGVRPRLLAWKDGHIHAASAEMMTDSSRTAAFKISSGDTVSFYREFKWYNPKTQSQDTNNFRSLDTLDYAVELVDRATNGRIALLDSFGVLPRVVPGSPVVYGTRPIMSKVQYAIPYGLTADSAFVRVRTYTRGDGPYLPIRKDDETVGASYALDLGIWDYYLSLYGGSLGKRSIGDLNAINTRRPQNSLLSVLMENPGTIAVRFSSPPGSGPIEVVIYDAVGNKIFVPFATRSIQSAEIATYTFTASGIYFVALQVGGVIVEAKKITISL
jgi:hypothetical protein